MRKVILYVTVNDGSDTRINKEINSLYKHADIYYIGIGKDKSGSFIQDQCKSFKIVKGSHRNIWTIIRYYVLFLKIYFSRKYDFVHVINEQNYILFLPMLTFHKNVVLDLFDSMFLKKEVGLIGKKLQRFIYTKCYKIIVTDENRKTLMPELFFSKYEVIPNYPYKYYSEGKTHEKDKNKVSIFYYGSLTDSRGSLMLKNLLKHGEGKIRIVAAGWIGDQSTQELSELENVSYIGVVDQKKALSIAESMDYLLCLYEPSNNNNINASPNKIWDAIQVKTPLIINNEIKVASFVKEQQIGIVIPSFYNVNYLELINLLEENKNKFSFSKSLSDKHVWEGIENKFLNIYHI